MARRLPSQPPVLPGFSYVHVLGSGGFADVFLYELNMPRRQVAVKVMLSEVVNDQVRQMFQAEANLMAQLSGHPSILTVYQAGVSADGRPYLVMELCSASLSERYRRERISVAEVLRIAIKIGSAVETAHRAGVLHRDIKPENLFVRVDAAGHLQLKVVDFGVSDVLGDPRAADAMVGTLEYMAPEVMLNERPPGTVSDLYALGVVAYECCTGRVPFAGETLGELLIALANGRFDPATAFRADLPPAIDGWFARALHRDPDARFGSAKEMAEQAHLVLKRQATPSLSNVRRVASSQEVVRISSMMAKAPPPPPPATPAPPPAVRNRMPSFIFEEERPSAPYRIIRPRGDEE